MLRVEDFHIANSLNISSGNNARSFFTNNHALWTITMHTKSDFLDVQYNVSDIFANTSNSREFMQHAVDLNSGYCSTLQRRKQHSAK